MTWEADSLTPTTAGTATSLAQLHLCFDMKQAWQALVLGLDTCRMHVSDNSMHLQQAWDPEAVLWKNISHDAIKKQMSTHLPVWVGVPHTDEA